jgi:nitrogen fixation protein NifU and related proteins
MSLSDDLYRETILDHYHNPRNQGELAEPTVVVEGVNPLCGDELTLHLDVHDGTIKDIRLKSRGCSISMASGSMMTESVHGRSLEQVEAYAQLFKTMMLGKEELVELPEDLEELEALAGVRKYPVRIKCAILPWNTLLEGIATAREAAGAGKTLQGKAVTME